MAQDFAKLYKVAGMLLTCACDKLELTAGGCPDRRCVVPGLIPEAANCCTPPGGGQLTVNVVRTFPSRQFPVPDLGTPNNCNAPWQVVTYAITIFRCMPVGDMHHAPTCDALDDAALLAITDMEAIRVGVFCCLIDRDTAEQTIGMGYEWTFGDHLTTEPQGGCVGSVLNVQVGIPICWEC